MWCVREGKEKEKGTALLVASSGFVGEVLMVVLLEAIGCCTAWTRNEICLRSSREEIQ